MRQRPKGKILAPALLVLGLAGGHSAMGQKPGSAREQQQRQERQLLQAAERDPRDPRAAGALGEFYLREQKWKPGADWLGKAYVLSGKNDAIEYDLAYALTQAGDLDKAQALIEELASRKDTPRLHSLLGDVEVRRGDLVSAAREYHRAAELEPSEANIFELATFLLQHRKYIGALDDSIKFFQYGVTQYPRSARMMIGLGVAQYAATEYDQAVRDFCSAVDLDPTDQRPIQFLGRASKVSPSLASEVDRRLEDFAQRYPQSAAANYFYALSLWERGGGREGQGQDKIEVLLKRAETISPRWYEPHYQLGVLYQAQKRYPEAVREMQKAVEIDPDFYPAHYRLALLYHWVGKRSASAAEAALVENLKKKEDSEDVSAHDVTQ